MVNLPAKRVEMRMNVFILTLDEFVSNARSSSLCLFEELNDDLVETLCAFYTMCLLMLHKMGGT